MFFGGLTHSQVVGMKKRSEQPLKTVPPRGIFLILRTSMDLSSSNWRQLGAVDFSRSSWSSELVVGISPLFKGAWIRYLQ